MLTIKNVSCQFFSFASADFENLKKSLCGFPCAKNTYKIRNQGMLNTVSQLGELHNIIITLLC